MVTPQGFNALLKIVEEPPEHVKFVFATTEPEKVIGTIRSRTHHYPFRLVPPAKLADYMQRLCDQEGVKVAPGVLSFVTRAGGGSVRDSLSVLDQLIAGSGDDGLTYEGAVSLLGFTDGELLDATIDALAHGDGAATFRQIDKVIESGHDPRRFVEDLLERLRDLIIVAAVNEGAGQVLRGVPEDQLERMRVQQAAFGPGALSRAADIANAGLTEMTGANSPRLQLELICARILLPAASGEQGYAARLDRLERRLDVGGVPSAARGSTPPPSAPQPAPGSSASASAASAPPVTGPRAPATPLTAPARTVSDVTPPAAAASAPAAASPSASAAAHPAAPDDAGRIDAARAEVGAPPVMTPAESVGRSSAVGERHAAPARDRMGEGRPGPEAAQPGPAAAQPAAEPPAPDGGMDTAAIRRAWPDVLGRIFGMRRATWTFVSQNAQIMAFDGKTLTLGIATVGLTNTFRSGNHAELVRQALIDELGVDAVVDGVAMPEAGAGQAPMAPPAGSVPSGPPEPGPTARPAGGPGQGHVGQSPAGPGDRIQGDRSQSGDPSRAGIPGGPAQGDHRRSGGSWGDAGAGHAPGGSSSEASGGRAPSALADTGLSPAASGRPLEDNAGWGSVSAPAPDWATAGPEPSVQRPTAGGTDTMVRATGTGRPASASGEQASDAPAPTSTAVRGASAVRASFAQARSAPLRAEDGPARAPLTDDSAVSDDDEDIEQSGDVGRTVIEKILGGRVVSERDD
jgi:DNA polymerase-3 subunit gamma/tau